MPNWVDKIVEATAEAESPERFQYWSAMTAIAAVVKKNVWLDRYYYKLYPNLYVFLVARSGMRKGNPVTFAKKLVQEVNNTRVILGRSSIQAVLKDLGKAHSIEGGGVLKEASAYIVSGELAAFLVQDPQALTILTDLYDTYACEPEWKNTLKVSGVDVLKNPCITLLGATNEEHFKEAVPNSAIGGGFIARTLIVLESKRRTINDLMDAPKIKVPSTQELTAYLKCLAKLKGQFTMAPEAKDIYREWYHQLANIQHTDKTGTMERLGDTVLKVAMVVSLANGCELVIEPIHMNEAIEKCVECLGGMKQVTMGAGKSEFAGATALVLRELIMREGNKVTRKQFLSKFWGEMDSITLDRVMETLFQAGAVEAQQIGKEIVYTMKTDVVEAYKKFKMEIN